MSTTRRRRQHDAGVEDVAQRLPFEELHRDVGDVAALADVVDGDDVRVVEASRRTRFTVEALLVGLGLDAREPHVDRLDRDHAVDQRVAGAVNHAHRPAADLLEELVAT